MIVTIYGPATRSRGDDGIDRMRLAALCPRVDGYYSARSRRPLRNSAGAARLEPHPGAAAAAAGSRRSSNGPIGAGCLRTRADVRRQQPGD